MKLDRNTTEGHVGKYALILNRKIEDCRKPGAFGELSPAIADALKLLKDNGILDETDVGTPGEFFVIRLKDKYAADALAAYAAAAMTDDPEYAQEIADMAARAGANHPHCKRPD